MGRRSFDKIMSVTGLVLAVVLAVAGVLLLWGGNFAHNTVTEQLTAQKITFDTDASTLPPALASYAGQQVTTGPQAQAYSDLIAEHIAGMANGKTYSEVSSEWIAGGRKDANLAQLRTTLFMGETLRGMLLNAYAFWTIGTIALIAAWAAFAAAGVLLVLGILGLVHLNKTHKDEVIFAPEMEKIPA